LDRQYFSNIELEFETTAKKALMMVMAKRKTARAVLSRLHAAMTVFSLFRRSSDEGGAILTSPEQEKDSFNTIGVRISPRTYANLYASERYWMPNNTIYRNTN